MIVAMIATYANLDRAPDRPPLLKKFTSSERFVQKSARNNRFASANRCKHVLGSAARFGAVVAFMTCVNGNDSPISNNERSNMAEKQKPIKPLENYNRMSDHDIVARATAVETGLTGNPIGKGRNPAQ